MTRSGTVSGRQFLTVEEAAEILGQSRLRVREAAARGLLVSRRDNEGRLRIDLPEKPRRVAGKGWPEDTSLSPEETIGFLFDEIEELAEAEARQEAKIRALADLAERQADALDRAGVALEKAEGKQARLSALLDRALSHLENSDVAATRLAGLSERALTRLEETGVQLAQSRAQVDQLEVLLARAMALAEDSADGGKVGEATERAFALLDNALSRAEAESAMAGKSAALLDRALAASDRLEAELKRKDGEIETRRGQVETALGLSERAVAAAQAAEAPAPRGFWARLFGRRG